MPVYEDNRRPVRGVRRPSDLPELTDEEWLRPPGPGVAPVLGPTEIPVEVLDWWGRLLHEPKLEYAAACVDWQLGRGPKPERPDAKWAAKVERQAARLCRQYAHELDRAGLLEVVSS